jgi:hypothetical protein
VTLPLVSVATVRLLFILEAKKFRRLETEVVAITPFTVEVITPEAADIVFPVIIDEVACDPPTFEVITFPVDESVFGTEIESTVKLEIVALVIEALAENRFVLVEFAIVELVPIMFDKFAVPVTAMFVPVALSNIRLEM